MCKLASRQHASHQHCIRSASYFANRKVRISARSSGRALPWVRAPRQAAGGWRYRSAPPAPLHQLTLAGSPGRHVQGMPPSSRLMARSLRTQPRRQQCWIHINLGMTTLSSRHVHGRAHPAYSPGARGPCAGGACIEVPWALAALPDTSKARQPLSVFPQGSMRAVLADGQCTGTHVADKFPFNKPTDAMALAKHPVTGQKAHAHAVHKRTGTSRDATWAHACPPPSPELNAKSIHLQALHKSMATR